MANLLQWDKAGERIWETGVSKGVLYPMSDTAGTYADGVVWNGLTNVTKSPSGAEASALYADNIKYLNLMSVEELEGSIEAFTYPDEFGKCDGSLVAAKGLRIGQQARRMFGLCFQTKVGTDIDPEDGYKIHIIYGCLAGPSEKSYDTVNDSPEAISFNWNITTTPVDMGDDFKPTASLEIYSKECTPESLTALEKILYGTAVSETPEVVTAIPARLPMPDEVITILGAVGTEG